MSQQSAANKDIAQEGKVTVSWIESHKSNLFAFTTFSSLCPLRRFAEAGAVPYRLPFGPLNDAAEGRARACVPTIMMFVQSLHGISHNKIEDTKEEHLEMAVTAFDKLAEKAMRWIAG